MPNSGLGRKTQWANQSAGGGGSGGTLLSVLPGGAQTAQIANPGGLTDAKGNAVTCTRSTANYARTGTSGDPSNYIANPEDLSGADWNGNSHATKNYGIAPDGTLTASRYQNAGGNIFAGTQEQIAATRAPGGNWTSKTVTFSAYVKSNTGSNQAFSIWITEQGVNDYYSPDLTATTSWQRFTFTVTTSASAATQVNPGLGVASSLAAYDVQVWGAKFEQAASATAYVSPMLRMIPANTPRVEPEGLLQEGPATNTTQWSQDLSNAAWGKTLATATANAGIAPDGTLTASRLQLGTSGPSGSFAVITSTDNAPSGTTRTVSGYVRSNTGSNQLFALRQTYSAVADYFSSDFTATNAWQRFSFTQVFPTNASTTCTSGVAASNALAAADILVWGMQYELNTSGGPSSQIPTTSGAGTRPVEVLSSPNPLTTPGQYSMSATLTPLNGAAWGQLSRFVVGLGTESSANSARLISTAGTPGSLIFSDFDGAATQLGLVNGSYSPAAGSAHAFKASKSNLTTFALTDNGGPSGAGNFGSGTGMAAQPSTFYIGTTVSGGDVAYGWLKDILVSKS